MMNNFFSIKYLVIIAFLMIRCDNGNEPKNENVEDFNYIFKNIENYYPFLEFKNINTDSIYTVYLPLVKNASKNNVSDIYVDLLSELKDGHANVMHYTGYPIYGYRIPRREKDMESFDIEVVKKYLGKEFQEFDNLYKYEVFPDNIGYVYYSSFSGDILKYGKIDAILEYLKNTKGLIFDIRNNGGGNNISSYYIIKRFLSTPIEGTQWTKKGGGNYPIETINPEGDYRYTKPIVVLINGVSFSSAEGFANLCKKISHITLIGDTTGGGSGVPEIFLLQNSSIQLRIPVRCEMRFDGDHYEWNGIIPDILIPQTMEDIDNNRDKQLEQALDYLNRKQP